MKEITVEAVTANLPEVMAFLDGELEKAGCPMKTQMQIDLAADEIFSNISMYAYPSGTGEVTVRFESEDSAGVIWIVFLDTGTPFNPLEGKTPDITLSAEERPIGGLGIHLVRHIMDDIRYERKDDKNILTLIKHTHL